MQIVSAENQEQWNNWQKENSRYNPFSQSWEWGDLLIKEGEEIDRLVIIEEDNMVAQAQVAYTKLPLGWKYAFCPKGPIVAQQNLESEVYEALSHYFKQEKCLFFRFEPEIFQNQMPNVKRTIDINPPATLILDLTKSEQELLQGMHQKTRYNIRLAEKKEIKVEDKKNFEAFFNLMKQTGTRDDFRLHHKDHYKQVLSSPLSIQLTAYFGNKPIACALFISFGNTFTYLYGASDYEYRSIMAPHLLQWRAIQYAKKMGYKYYDFFGVAPMDSLRQLADRGNDSREYVYDSKHQYAGVTRFKLGFGGFSYQAAGTYDLIIDRNKYYSYQILRRLRRLV